MIHIYSQPEEGMRLKNFSATYTRTKGGQLTITLQIDDPDRVGWLLRQLEDHGRAQKAADMEAAAAAKHKGLPAPKRLALPKPEGKTA